MILPLLFATTAVLADPRNTAEYHVLFDLETKGKSALVAGYGAYVQVYENSNIQWIRYCDNFEGSGTSGRPNTNLERFKLVPFGTSDHAAYGCRDFTLDSIASGEPLIELGSKKFFAVKSDGWSAALGGELLFQFAKKLPLLGSPTYRTLRVRATRASSNLDYLSEVVLPRTGVFPAHFYLFNVTGSGLGIPNGINSLLVDPNEQTELSINIDGLEGAIQIRGTGRSDRTR